MRMIATIIIVLMLVCNFFASYVGVRSILCRGSRSNDTEYGVEYPSTARPKGVTLMASSLM